MHGFEIMGEISERTNGAWRPGPSAIYPALMSLEKSGYIRKLPEEKQGNRVKMPFAITEKGRKATLEFKNLKNNFVDIIAGMEDVKDSD
jgi:DNA-binding PadR family transcriptional regulator